LTTLREELDEYIERCNASDEFEYVRTEEVMKIIEKRIDEFRKSTIEMDKKNGVLVFSTLSALSAIYDLKKELLK
jgi:hypothetical protein